MAFAEDFLKPEDTGPTKSNLIDYAGNDPQDMQAQVIRAQDRDYEERFAPLEKELIGMTKENGNKQANRAAKTLGQQNKISRQAFKRDLSRTGVALNQRQKASLSKARGLDAARNQANVENLTRRRVKDENMQSTASLIGIGRNVQQGVNRDLSTASSLQAGREAANANAKAANSAQKSQMAASVAGLALAFFL